MPSYPSRKAFETDYPNVKGTARGPHNLLLVLVTAKKPEDELDPADILPKTVEIGGDTYHIDVVPVGIPHFLDTSDTDGDTGADPTENTTVADHRRRHRPAPGGISIGNEAIGAGTMGSPKLRHKGDPVVLSNAHVAAESRLQFQPSRMDGGNDYTPIGTLRETSDLDPSRTQTTDSALINVNPKQVSNEVLGLGPLVGFADAGFGTTVYKSGRTTGVTSSELLGRDAAINVAYGPETIRFSGCEVYGRMSAPGDSGSLIGRLVSDGFEACSLLFAGSPEATIGVPMSTVEAYHGELEVPYEGRDDESGNESPPSGSPDSDGGSDSDGDTSDGDGDEGEDEDEDVIEPDPDPDVPVQHLRLKPTALASTEYSFAIEGDVEFSGTSSTQVGDRINGWMFRWTKNYRIEGHITDAAIPESVTVWLNGESVPPSELAERSQEFTEESE